MAVPFPKSVHEALSIVRGRVGASYSDWVTSSDGGKRIYTFTDLQVDEVIKGSAPRSQIEMRELGGEKDGIGMDVPGAARFTQGEDVVVFLGERNEDGSYPVRGMSMGKYNVEKDSDGQESLTGPALFASEHVMQPPGQGRDDTASRKKWTLEALRQLVDKQRDEQAKADSHTDAMKKSVAPAPVRPAPTPRVQAEKTPVVIGGSPAPQLQNSQPEEFPEGSPSSSRYLLFLGLGLVAAAGLFIGLNQARKR